MNTENDDGMHTAGRAEREVRPADPERTDFAKRCALAANCLPVAEYRTWLERLHADMLAEIERLKTHAVVLANTERHVERERWTAAVMAELDGNGQAHAIVAYATRA